jgi:Zn-dependent peptidase ImmA (M78 family)/DNA-binding XRE family transcriptional regulator
MAKSLSVDVVPEVLKWLRTSAGWEIEDVSKKLGTSPEAVKNLESGKRNPTLRQLHVLSEVYKRPLASFFLSKPKQEKPMPKDYRLMPNRIGIFDRKTIIAIRRSRSLQNISKDLSLNISYETKRQMKKVMLTDDPELLASEYRKSFALDIEKQRKFRDAYKMFGYLRDVLEDRNILVFQFSMPIEDARGFALADEAPNSIVINSKDSIEARLFTLMHEFGHIILGETVIDIPEESLAARNNIEAWCNAFSSAFLLPKEVSIDLFNQNKDYLTETDTLNALSRKYKVSKAVLLVQMVNLNYISRQEFESVLARYAPKEAKAEKKEKQVMGMASDQKCLSEMGNKFVSLVANNFDKEFITYNDALSFLSIKSRNFDKVLARARK